MINRQLYTIKFKSARLKKFDYNIKVDYYQALANKEIISLSDNQILRSIREVVFNKTKNKEEAKKRILDRNLLEIFYKGLNKIQKQENSKENQNKLKNIKQRIIDMCFIPEYISIVVDDNKHYDELYENGVIVNGITYYRLSSSAGQGRKSTVVFCSNEILETLNEILDNGRDKTKKFSPSKFNAYKGTYGSATKVVTTPRFCVVPDYYSDLTFDVNWVTETEGEQDDKIELKEITRSYNRWDGMGLISPEMAEIWSRDLDLDYIPSEFCIRQSYIKGMCCVFPFHEYCEKKNNGNYRIKTIYKDKEGNSIEVDLRDIDIIISESQFKLWDSYISQSSYEENCKKHNLNWGVSLYTDKKLKDNIKMNYQFLQVQDIKKEDIPKLCEKFVNWIQGVNSENIWYTLLFLIGTDVTKDSLKRYFEEEGNYWIKALIVNHDLIHDKYIKQKIYNLIKKKIERGCIGNIILDGNNQTLVSDPYAMMQYLCGEENPQGLLKKNQYYANYWNERDVKKIIGMRPPLTYRSEVTELNLVNTEDQRYWYRYLYGGIIVNIHGHETDNWAGSDFDYDFLSTTSNEVMLKSRYENELPVVYEAPKPNKIVFTDKDLFEADKFTFGSIIGSITNKSTSGIALLKYLEEYYGVDSREYKTVLNRIKMCTKLQSAQIDKAKIGKNVKGIPKIWIDRNYIENLNLPKSEEEFLKSIMLDRHPYFFIHLYSSTKNKYKKYMEEENLSSLHKFGIGIYDLLNKKELNENEKDYVKKFYQYMPVIDSNSTMNNICKYIEDVDYDIKNKIKDKDDKNIYLLLMKNKNIIENELFEDVLKKYKEFKKNIRQLSTVRTSNYDNKYDETKAQEVNSLKIEFRDKMSEICSNIYEVVDCLIYVCYKKYPSNNKDLLWNIYGDIILENLINENQGSIMFPFPNEDGNIEYLNKNFKLEEISL